MTVTQEMMQILEGQIKVTPQRRAQLKKKIGAFFKAYNEFHSLTPAEKSLLKQIYADSKKGLLREDSAATLGISIKTLQGQITHLNKKLGVTRIQKILAKFERYL